MLGLKCVLLIPLAASLLVQQKCDLAQMANATPEQVQKSAQDGLRPYFPNVVIQVIPQKQLLVAVTCTKNIGHEMIVQIAQKMPQDPNVQQLKTLREFGGLIGAKTYRTFIIGFEHEAISLQVDQNLQPGLLKLTNQQLYERQYNQACGFPDTPIADNSSDSRVVLGQSSH
jgi:hypothetical protein